MNTFTLLLRRACAFLYDLLLLTALFFIVTGVLLLITGGEAIQHPAFYALLWLIAGVFFTGFWRRGGQTLGMSAWQLRLIDDEATGDAGANATNDAEPTSQTDPEAGVHAIVIDRKRLWLRFLAGSLLFGIGFLWAPFDARGRTANDRLSRTRIIKDSAYLKR